MSDKESTEGQDQQRLVAKVSKFNGVYFRSVFL